MFAALIGLHMAIFLQFLLLTFLPFDSLKSKPEAVLSPHPFYISVTEINQNAAAKSLELSCKFFADDLEQTLEKANNARLDISSAKDKALFDKYIPDYVNKHLQLVVDGKPVNLTYVGYEKEKESAYCYFEIANLASPKQIDAVNSLLHDFRTEQINIMHVTLSGKRQSTKLDYPETRASFRF